MLAGLSADMTVAGPLVDRSLTLSVKALFQAILGWILMLVVERFKRVVRRTITFRPELFTIQRGDSMRPPQDTLRAESSRLLRDA
jgi:hypothetical protein